MNQLIQIAHKEYSVLSLYPHATRGECRTSCNVILGSNQHE